MAGETTGLLEEGGGGHVVGRGWAGVGRRRLLTAVCVLLCCAVMVCKVLAGMDGVQTMLLGIPLSLTPMHRGGRGAEWVAGLSALEEDEIPLSFDDQMTRAMNHADRVQVNFYMESQCPGCRIYTSIVLANLMRSEEFRNMIDLKVFPFGNGILYSDDTVDCQHGEAECIGNRLIACMQQHYPITDEDQRGFLAAMSCIATSSDDPEIAAPKCCVEGKLDYDVVRQCAYGKEGQELQLQAAKDTYGLDPPHQWSPWITLNGQPVLHKAWELLPQVCDKYTGPKGELCRNLEEDKKVTVVDGEKVVLTQQGQQVEGSGRGFYICEPGSARLHTPMPY